jgi:hypothetical protein
LNRIGVTAAIAIVGGAVTTTALAAPKEYCQAYAQAAVNQYTAMDAQNIGCTGFRWHNWYDGHYQWCRSTSKAAAMSEAITRKRTLFGGAC